MVGAWHGHGMASVNQTRPHCVNQMVKTHSKPLAARHGRVTAWTRHAMCESTITVSEESHRVWCVREREASVMRRPWRTGGCCDVENKKM
jgi:hypothetical protein